MADNSSYRSYRQNDPFARPQQRAEPTGSAGAQSDPLAELARLIGQNDPFADFGREQTAPAPAHPADVSAPDWGTESAAPSAYTNPPPEPAPFAGAPYPSVDPYRAAEPYADPYQAYPYQAAGPAPGYAPVASDPHFETPRYDSQAYGEQSYDAGAAFQPAAFDPTVSAAAAAPPPGYEPDPYFRGDPHMRAPGEDLYDDAPPARRRSPIAIALAVAGLVVVGVAGAYAYRTYFSDAGGAKPPPVIQADTSPSKIVPPTKAGPQSGKLINDRLAAASQGERVVSREEQPVDIKAATPPTAPRVVFPGPVPNAASAGASTSAPSRPSSVIGEPKRVRTVTIRPNQPVIPAMPQSAPPPAPAQPAAAAQPTPAPAPPPRAPARAASAPPVSVELPPASAPRRTVTPRRVQREPQRIAPPPAARSGNAPLSLTPGRSVPPPPAAAVRSRPARVAAAPSAPAVNGGYNVQVSSQRSDAAARASFRNLQARYAAQLGGRSPIIRRINLGSRGVYYRAMVGPFATAAEASSLCSQLKAAGGQCIVQRN